MKNLKDYCGCYSFEGEFRVLTDTRAAPVILEVFESLQQADVGLLLIFNGMPKSYLQKMFKCY